MRLKKQPYFLDPYTKKLKFYGSDQVGRVRKPRLRAQKMYTRLGGNPFLPMRVVCYNIPALYYSALFRHVRKQQLDYGICKVKYGIERSSEWNN